MIYSFDTDDLRLISFFASNLEHEVFPDSTECALETTPKVAPSFGNEPPSLFSLQTDSSFSQQTARQ